MGLARYQDTRSNFFDSATHQAQASWVSLYAEPNFLEIGYVLGSNVRESVKI
jgi:hypothetical protein